MRARLTLSLLATAVVLLFASNANAADATWYAAPGGSGIACTQPAPCPIAYALGTQAQNTDTVVLAGGDYPVATSLTVNKAISIEGAATGVPTRLIGGGGAVATLNYTGAVAAGTFHISDLRAQSQSSNGTAIFVNNQNNAEFDIDRVYGEATGTSGLGIWVLEQPQGHIVIRSSVGRTTASGGIGLRVSGGIASFGTVDMLGVVADSRGPLGTGIQLSGGGDGITNCGHLYGAIKNSYARAAAGADSDVTTETGFNGISSCKTTFTSTNSNWRSTSGNGVLNSVADQHTVDGLFADAAGGDYHELAGSPTIDAGAADAQLGAQDIDHNARVYGLAPDIGAYEFTPQPDVTKPVGTSLKLAPKCFFPKSGKPASIASAKKTAKGSKAKFTLSEAATVKFVVQRQSGIKGSKKCSSASKSGKKRPTYKNVKGSFSRPSTSGANSFKFSGHVGGKALKPGSYRLVGVATDAAGNASKSFVAKFAILKR
jgi:hypothetical protein